MPRLVGRPSPRRREAGDGPRARGSADNPASRLEPLHVEPEPEELEAQADATERRDPRTRVYRDRSRSILSRNQSPDVPFETSLNPYRGCEHGCSYCYARPTHEYLGLSAGLDFETRLIAKPEAPALLRDELRRPRWRPQVLALSGVTDPYQPIERQLRITRGCLEVALEHRQPIGLITKSTLVTRDLDLLAALARARAVSVTLSLTTLDPELARRMEPRAAQPSARLRTLQALRAAGVPAGVNLAPITPGLNDHEIPAMIAASARAGAQWVRMLMLRLPHGLPGLFESWLETHYPERRARVLALQRAMHRGELNDPRFGDRMRGSGPHSDQIWSLFEICRRRAGLDGPTPELDVSGFRLPGPRQLELL